MDHKKRTESIRLIENIYNQTDKYADDIMSRYSLEGKRHQDLNRMLGRYNNQDGNSEEMLDLIIKAREESVKKYERHNQFFFEDEAADNDDLVQISTIFGECLNHESSLFGYKLHILSERCFWPQEKHEQEEEEVLCIDQYVYGVDDNPTGLQVIDDVYRLALEEMITEKLGAVMSYRNPFEACHEYLIKNSYHLQIEYTDQINNDLSLSVNQREIDERDQNHDSIKSQLCQSFYTLQGFRLRNHEIQAIGKLNKNGNTD